jgi:serine/threonine protein kinase
MNDRRDRSSSAAAAWLSTGDVVGDWTIVRRVSHGAVGDVYEVRSAKIASAALKWLRPEQEDEVAAMRVRREAATGAALQHPNLNLVFDRGEYLGQPYFVTELLHGNNLREQLRTAGPSAIGAAIVIGIAVCSALDAIHVRAEAIHRDIKPENIFLTSDGAVKVLDLGYAKYRDLPLTRKNEAIGSVAYMAPEQFQRQESARSDLYALGLVLYELVAGIHPFVDLPEQWPSTEEMIRRHFFDEPNPLPALVSDCPDSFGRLVARCLSKSQDDRPPRALALRGLLRDELESWQRRDQKPPKRR